MGTSYNCLGEAVLTSTYNLCFGAKNKKNRYTPANSSFTTSIKVGFEGVPISRTCFPDVRKSELFETLRPIGVMQKGDGGISLHQSNIYILV